MLDGKEKEELRQGMRIIRLVWAAMILSLGVYLFVCYRTAAQRPARAPAAALPTARAVLIGVAVVELVAIRFLRRYMLETGAGTTRQPRGRTARGAPSHPAAARYMAATVTTLALSESIGIFGMVLFFTGADFGTLYVFMGVSAAAMIHYRPKDEELESVAVAMKAGPAATKVGP